MEACGFFVFVGYLGVNIPRRLDARSRDALVPSATISRRRRRSWWCGRATTSARRRKTDRRDHVRGARRSRPRGPSSRVDRSSAALGRGLFFPTRAFLFFFTCRPRRWRRLAHRAGLVGFVFAKKQSLSGQCSRCWVYASITIRTLSLHRANACETDRDQP